MKIKTHKRKQNDSKRTYTNPNPSSRTTNQQETNKQQKKKNPKQQKNNTKRILTNPNPNRNRPNPLETNRDKPETTKKRPSASKTIRN